MDRCLYNRGHVSPLSPSFLFLFLFPFPTPFPHPPPVAPPPAKATRNAFCGALGCALNGFTTKVLKAYLIPPCGHCAKAFASQGRAPQWTYEKLIPANDARPPPAAQSAAPGKLQPARAVPPPPILVGEGHRCVGPREGLCVGGAWEIREVGDGGAAEEGGNHSVPDGEAALAAAEVAAEVAAGAEAEAKSKAGGKAKGGISEARSQKATTERGQSTVRNPSRLVCTKLPSERAPQWAKTKGTGRGANPRRAKAWATATGAWGDVALGRNAGESTNPHSTETTLATTRCITRTKSRLSRARRTY